MRTTKRLLNTSEIEKKFNHLWQLVGNTPMLKILYEYRGKTRAIYAKCEHYNLTGSIKDRIVIKRIKAIATIEEKKAIKTEVFA